MAEDQDNMQLAVSSALEDAADYVDTELSPQRVLASEYYDGEPFGDEEKGRSSAVSRDVSDTVRAVLPSLMRVFFGSDNPVEFVPEHASEVATAEQATEYVNYVFARDNPGFEVLHSALKDALIRRTGPIKVWWDDALHVRYEQYEALDDTALMALEQDEQVEVVEQETYDDPEAVREAEAQYALQLQQAEAEAAARGVPPDAVLPSDLPEKPLEYPQLHDVEIRRKSPRNKVRVAAVPPDEILVGRELRSFDADGVTTAGSVIAHRTELTVSTLVSMGYDEEELKDYGSNTQLEANEERLQREPEAFGESAVEAADSSQRKVLYTEAWMPYDADDDGIAELRKVCCLGDQYTIVDHEPADFVPIADLCPDPEPHRALGNSLADLVMEVQRIKSSILRGMFDSLAQSIRPRTAVVEGEVNLDDVLNNEVGGIVRMRRPGMAQPLETPFVGQQAFPMIEYMDQVKEKRTGITDATQGLNADVLQSTTKAAVTATVEAAQQQIELIGRVIAESGLRKMYRIILKTVVANQGDSRHLNLKGRWQDVDPSQWRADMDASVNTALGSGNDEQKLQRLSMVADKQEEIIKNFGPNNPMVTLSQYANTLIKQIEMAGLKDTSRYMNQLPADFQMPEPEGSESPEDKLVGVKREEIQANIEKKRAELQLEKEQADRDYATKREEMLRRDDRERDRQEAEALLRAAQIQAENGYQVDMDRLFAMIHRDRSAEQQGQYS